MPYIKDPNRRVCDVVVDEMLARRIQPSGELNYILFKYCRLSVEPSYNNYKNYIAELTECAEEIRRRFLAPYEDKKILENGDA